MPGPSPLVTLKKSSDRKANRGIILVVGKAAARLATARNLIKRRIRSILGTRAHEFQPPLVIIARKRASEAPFGELKGEIEQGLARLKK